MSLPSSNRIVFDLNFVEDSINELEDYFKLKTNFVKYLKVASNRFAKVQDEAIKLAYIRLLDNAEGVFLTDIADRLFIKRGDQNDNQLKAFIKLRVLKQTSEATRKDIVDIIRLISGGEYVRIYKGRHNFLDITFPFECLAEEMVIEEFENLFPINSNLLITSNIMGKLPVGAGWSYDTEDTISAKLGVAGFDGVSPTNITGYTAPILISSE